jgi:hypothetical protein
MKRRRLFSVSQAKKFKAAFRFIAGKNQAHNAYCNLLRSALDYKYRNCHGFAIPISNKEMFVNPVFELKASDRILIKDNLIINGQKLKELFITTIFAKYLDRLDSYDDFEIKGKMFTIGWDKFDNGIDTIIFITDPLFFKHQGKWCQAIAELSSLMFFIQVKEYFDYSSFQATLNYPKAFNIKRLNISKLRSYQELILIYVRDFCELNYGQIEADLQYHGLEGKNIIVCGQEYIVGTIPSNYVFFDFRKGDLFYTPIGSCDLPIGVLPGPLT